MFRAATVITLFFCCCSLVHAMASKEIKPEIKKDGGISIFFTGSDLGQLKPCGCIGGQLGGIERRAAVFSRVKKDKRLIVNTGDLIAEESEQSRIKFNILIEAFSLLDYDVINLTDDDIAIANQLGLRGSIESMFNVISSAKDSSLKRSATQTIKIDNQIAAVTIASFDSASDEVDQLQSIFGIESKLKLNIVILGGDDEEVIEKIKRLGVVDCIVVQGYSDEPYIEREGYPLVFSVGQLGKYVVRLDVRFVNEKAKLSFSSIGLTEQLEDMPELVDLYTNYQLIVKESGLLEKHVRVPLGDDLEYVGSDTCSLCHAKEYEKWTNTKHSSAFKTLVDVGSEYDPECVVCHVAGMDYQGGFTSDNETEHLKNVGCENCHGPSSKHIISPLKHKTGVPKSNCGDCHTPEHSGNFLENEQVYFENIIHWTEPNNLTDVQL